MPAQTLSSPTKAYLPFNPSQQLLVSGQASGDAHSGKRQLPKASKRATATVAILFFVNLINYMDRLTIAGVLSKLQSSYSIGDAQAGALQTAFVVSYMIFAPVFGYCGDRHSRRHIMALGVFLWTIATIIGSFMPNYELFLLCRALVGIGEASYSTIAPTLISDLFVKEQRSSMLALFYFAIPLGSGLGYVVGSETAALMGGDWRWGLRVTPVLGLLAVFLILFVMVDPPRGESEGHSRLEATSYTEDLCSLASNKSFVWSTLAFTCVTFCTGALSWWGPKFMEAVVESSEHQSLIRKDNVALVFGGVTMFSGFVGVPLGSLLSTRLKPHCGRADPLICGLGLLTSAIFIGVGLIWANTNIYLTFALIFLGEVTLNLNWSIVADILLYIVVPTRRSTAEAVQILFSHAFGDAGSPYLIGMISDMLRAHLSSSVSSSLLSYTSMQYSLFLNSVVEVLGAIFFVLTAIYIVRDKRICDRMTATGGHDSYVSSSSSEDDVPPELLLLPPHSTPALVDKRQVRIWIGPKEP